MFPNSHRAIHLLPLIAALAFLAHVHYNKAMRSMRFEHHAVTASARGR